MEINSVQLKTQQEIKNNVSRFKIYFIYHGGHSKYFSKFFKYHGGPSTYSIYFFFKNTNTFGCQLKIFGGGPGTYSIYFFLTQTLLDISK